MRRRAVLGFALSGLLPAWVAAQTLPVMKVSNLVGDDPADWYPPLTGRRWPGAAGVDDEFDVWEAAE